MYNDKDGYVYKPSSVDDKKSLAHAYLVTSSSVVLLFIAFEIFLSLYPNLCNNPRQNYEYGLEVTQVTFAHCVCFLASLIFHLSQFLHFDESRNIYEKSCIYSMGVTVGILAAFNSYKMLQDDVILCENHFGLVIPIRIWIEFTVCAPLVVFTTSAVNMEVIYDVNLWIMFFGIMLCNFFGFMMSISDSLVTEVIYLTISTLCFVISAMTCLKMKRKVTIANYFAPKLSDLYANVQAEIEWRVATKNMRTLLFVIMPSFPIVYFSGIFNCLSSSQTFICLLFCNLVSKFVCSTSFSDAQVKLLDSLSSLRTVIETSKKARQTFLVFLCHEIRNPLNALSLGITLLKDRSPDINEATLGYMSSAIDMIVHSLNDAEYVQKIQNSRITFSKEPFNIFATVDEVIISVRKIMEKEGKHLYLQFPFTLSESVYVIGDRKCFQSALTNFLSQIISKTNRSTSFPIQVSIHHGKSKLSEEVMITIMVDDAGPGIERTVFSSLSEPYYQLQTNSNRELHLSSLSFLIAREMIELNSGQLIVIPSVGYSDRVKVGFSMTFRTYQNLDQTAAKYIPLSPTAEALNISQITTPELTLSPSPLALETAISTPTSIQADEVTFEPKVLVVDGKILVLIDMSERCLEI